jgi:hypothetical protein
MAHATVRFEKAATAAKKFNLAGNDARAIFLFIFAGRRLMYFGQREREKFVMRVNVLLCGDETTKKRPIINGRRQEEFRHLLCVSNMHA